LSSAGLIARGALFVVSAPSGGGKTSLTRAVLGRLAAHGVHAEISVSYTTRAPRAGEHDGVHYHFIDDAEFVAMIERGEFLEHAHVFGRRYGTGRKRTEDLLTAGCDLILDIDWQGARQVRAQTADVISIFVLPPSIEELERRLRARAQDDEATVHARMAAARAEMAHYDEYDYLIVNDNFERALDELAVLFLTRRLARPMQSRRYVALIESLLR